MSETTYRVFLLILPITAMLINGCCGSKALAEKRWFGAVYFYAMAILTGYWFMSGAYGY